MHVWPATHSYVWLPRKCNNRTHRRTDRRRTKWSLCATMLRRRHKNLRMILWPQAYNATVIKSTSSQCDNRLTGPTHPTEGAISSAAEVDFDVLYLWSSGNWQLPSQCFVYKPTCSNQLVNNLFLQNPHSGFTEVVNVSANQRPGCSSSSTHHPEKQTIGRGRRVLTVSISLKSVEWSLNKCPTIW